MRGPPPHLIATTQAYNYIASPTASKYAPHGQLQFSFLFYVPPPPLLLCQLCQWRRLLPLLVRCGPWLRPNCPSGHLRPWLPAHCGGPHLRCSPAAEEDKEVQDTTDVVQEVTLLARKLPRSSRVCSLYYMCRRSVCACAHWYNLFVCACASKPRPLRWFSHAHQT